MKPTLSIGLKFLGTVTLLITLVPVMSFAQAGRGGQGGGMAPGALGQGMQKILDQLDLTDDQKTKTDAIIKQTQSDVREAMQGLQDADPQDRRTKMQEIQKMMADGKDKIEEVLTPEQKKKFYPLNANMLLTRGTDMLGAMKTAAAKMEIDDDVRKQLSSVFDDTGKTLDGYKTDANAITDSAGETDFQQKLLKTQMDLNKQMRDVLGQEDAQKLMQAARQAGAGGGNGRAQGNRRRAKAASNPTPPSTQP